MPEVNFLGPEGRLEGRYHDAGNAKGPGVLFLHPHPQYGGTMNNRIIYELYRHFISRGASTLRFNFRGVGRSQGAFNKGEGELADAATALDWLQHQHQNGRESWIVGFSFGAWIAMQLLMRRPEVSGFICISPPANLYDFSFLAPCPASGLIIHGKEDKFVPEPHVNRLYDRLRIQKGIDVTYRPIEGADHFFTDKLDIVLKTVSDYLDDRKLHPIQSAIELDAKR